CSIPGSQRISRRILDRRSRQPRTCVRSCGKSIVGAGPRGKAADHSHRGEKDHEHFLQRGLITAAVPGPTTPGIKTLLREFAPQVLGGVARRYDDFAAAEDAVQEALIAAATQWPVDGIPD